MSVAEIVRVVTEHGPWAVLGVVGIMAARSRPVREAGRLLTIEMRWRYYRGKGIPDDELRRRLLTDDTTDRREATGADEPGEDGGG